ncbi:MULTISPECIES: ribose ABC transporter substrate-binding protein RbsB [unclassified Neisseria]|uniref:ribose ABC transporter substrate-binding protein RbsB n=1 Tax=unclassified Neisseria TaxID=2623750 RepID=UPI002665BE74|nr:MULTISPECIES: ribose ABC transporter substrate-binding protein RbsB [unclassified Neisseria]MDO1509182.1 ribose ABC transporter substrate-binding protein RbsB [Neisseria sp. MVDL19-042950]MDO1515539.1 ribose ABC transporter substrate-binding protein RbsB [Neisseria sp. MVDL18-041461]MDO1562898.1 ribose ABC transporter substrate-binding protein RbsB [Neisseria sp. MVDL20-010259]
MKFLRKASVLLITGILLTACGQQKAENAASGTASAATGDTVGLAISTQNNPFFVNLKEGAQAQADKLGLRLVVVDANDDSGKQAAGVDDLLQQNIKVLLINPTDSEAAAASVNRAAKAGIPVISIDRSVKGAEVTSHVASDNVAGGKMAAEFIVGKLPSGGEMVELEGIPGSSAARERGEGFHQVMDAQQNIKIVAKQPADFDRTKGLNVMENILQNHPNIKAVFAHNDEMALGAVKALEAANKKDVVVVGFDATDDAQAAVKAGKMAATVAQKPAKIGELGVDTAKKIIAGETVEKSIPVELELIKQ